MTTIQFCLLMSVMIVISNVFMWKITNYETGHIIYLKRLWFLYLKLRNEKVATLICFGRHFKKYDRIRKIERTGSKWMCYYMDLYRDDHEGPIPDYRDYKYCESCFARPTRSLIKLLWEMFAYDKGMRQIFITDEEYEEISKPQMKALTRLLDPNEYWQKKKVNS